MSEPAAHAGDTFLERRFRFAANGTTLARDTLAGLTTFIVMSYIIFVNPRSSASPASRPEPKGLPFAAALTATCLVAGVMTILMGALHQQGLRHRPGHGPQRGRRVQPRRGQGLTFPAAMGLIVLEGIAITILVLTGFREAIFKAIPLELKKAIAIGIGFFILFIGLVDGGHRRQAAHRHAGRRSAPLDVAARRHRLRPDHHDHAAGPQVARRSCCRHRLPTIFAIILNYAAGKDVGSPPGTARFPSDIFAKPDFSLVGDFNFGAFAKLGVTAAVLWVFRLMLTDFFDTMGTLVGVGRPGRLPRRRRATCRRSTAAAARRLARRRGRRRGVDLLGDHLHRVRRRRRRGGRTGWVAVVAGRCSSRSCSSRRSSAIVPPQATAPALIIVGYLMMATLTKAEDEAEGRPTRPQARRHRLRQLGIGLAAVLMIMIMPFTFSITAASASASSPSSLSGRHRAGRERCIRSCGSRRPRSSCTSSSRSSRTRSTGSETA